LGSYLLSISVPDFACVYCTVVKLTYLTLKYRAIEMCVRSHSRSSEMAPFENLGMVSYSNSIESIL